MVDSKNQVHETIKKIDRELQPKNGEQSQNKRELIILRGITTSQVNSAPKGIKTHGKNPYPARVFLKVDNQEQDIPVFFRLIDKKENCQFHSHCLTDCRYRD
jgi:hypothetical protein